MFEESQVIGSLGWIDLTAGVVVAVFFVLGVFRGFVWQISRVATIVFGYMLATLFGPFVASRIANWFPADTAPDLPRYLAYVLVFLAVLIVIGVIAGIVHRLVEQSVLSFYNRVGGGVLGVVTGWLFVMGLLTAIQVGYERAGLAGPVAHAAAHSRSTRISERVLHATDRVIPRHWRRVTEAWRNLLRGEEVVDADDEDSPDAVRREQPTPLPLRTENAGREGRGGPQSGR